jgi:GDP-L-fucose synthase
MVGSAITRTLKAGNYLNLVFSPYPPYDLTDQKIVADFFEREKPEFVFLAAAKVGGIISNSTYRAQFIYENLMIQNNIIHQSFLHGVKKLLYLGSSCIYPADCPQPVKEEYLLTGELEYTNEPYAIAKIAGIKMCESYNFQYATNYVSVMPTNLFGPNDNYDLETSHVLPALVRKMHLGKCLMINDWRALRMDLDQRPVEGVTGGSSEPEILRILSKYGITQSEIPNPNRAEGELGKAKSAIITLWGTGKPYREFLYVDDLADACLFVMNNIDFDGLIALSPGHYDQRKKIRNTHINIGTGRDLTIKELADMIKRITGFGGEIKWDDSKPDGTFRKQLDVTKINTLGWKEKTGLEEGIVSVYRDYTSNLK